MDEKPNFRPSQPPSRLVPKPCISARVWRFRAARNFFGAAHVWNTQCLQRKRENERSSDPNCLQMAVEARGGYRVDIQDLSMEFNRTLSLIPEANQACESFIEWNFSTNISTSTFVQQNTKTHIFPKFHPVYWCSGRGENDWRSGLEAAAAAE